MAYFFVTPLITFLIAWIVFETYYQKTGKIQSRFFFILESVVLGQVFAIPSTLLSLKSVDHIGVNGGIIMIFAIFCHLVLIVATVLLAFPVYNQVLKRVSKVSGNSFSIPKLGKFYRFIIAVVLLVVVYANLDIPIGPILSTGNITLFEYLPNKSYTEAVYGFTFLAKKHNDWRICDKINRSYIDVDECRFEVFSSPYKDKINSTKPEDVINCYDLQEKVRNVFGSSEEYYDSYFSFSDCSAASYIQSALRKNDPRICDSIFTHTNADTSYHAACTVHFFGSASWKMGCDRYGHSSQYAEYASCFQDSVRPPNPSPYYWFSNAEVKR